MTISGRVFEMNNRMSESRKIMLLEIASRMFESNGYKNFKIAEFAKIAAVSMSTVYTLFGSKEELYLMYIQSKIDDMFSAIDGFETDDPHLRLEHYISVIFKLAEQGKNILKDGVENPLFFTALSNEFSESAEKLYYFLTTCFMEINPFLERDQAHRLGYAFNGQLNGYLQYWATVGGDINALSDELYESALYMAKSSK